MAPKVSNATNGTAARTLGASTGTSFRFGGAAKIAHASMSPKGSAATPPTKKPDQVLDGPRTRRPSAFQTRPKSIGGPRPRGSVANALAMYAGVRTQRTPISEESQ